MRIAIVTDAWKPQTNGVVTTLTRTAEGLEARGHRVRLVTPESYRTVPLPTYPDIRLAMGARAGVRKELGEFDPEAVHIATEGPLGLAARRYCVRGGLGFTTSYHTQFPEYIRMRAPVPLAASYSYFRWFHSGARRTMVATESLQRQLLSRGFGNVVLWTRGVDTDLFRPREKSFLNDARPLSMYVGRVAVEKNLEDFLDLDIPGTKYVVGDGPALADLKARHPDVRFVGFRYGEELARYVAASDVFVFPSRTDTFGVVLLEAMACGVPVAAYPVTGPVDVVRDGETGALSEDLREAVLRALTLDGAKGRAYALTHSWQRSTQQFCDHLVINGSSGGCAATL